MASPISSEGFLNPDVVVGEFGVTPAMRVADFGCGTGHIAILLAQKIGPDGKLIAVDILEDKLNSVREQAKALGITNVETVRANLEVLGSSGLPDGSQDIATLINILFQSQKKADIIKEAVRVVKSGGKIICLEWKKAAGGFGPPDALRTSETDMQQIFSGLGVELERQFSPGQFHYGFIFRKS